MKSIIEGNSITRLNWQAHLQVKLDQLPVKNELPNSHRCCHELKRFFSLTELSIFTERFSADTTRRMYKTLCYLNKQAASRSQFNNLLRLILFDCLFPDQSRKMRRIVRWPTVPSDVTVQNFARVSDVIKSLLSSKKEIIHHAVDVYWAYRDMPTHFSSVEKESYWLEWGRELKSNDAVVSNGGSKSKSDALCVGDTAVGDFLLYSIKGNGEVESPETAEKIVRYVETFMNQCRRYGLDNKKSLALLHSLTSEAEYLSDGAGTLGFVIVKTMVAHMENGATINNGFIHLKRVRE